MKNIKTKILTRIFIYFGILLSLGTTAQDFRFPVVARITQTAPYPIYLNDYANPAQNNFSLQLEVRDNSLPVRRVRLKVWIEGGGMSIQSTPAVSNEQIIELSSGQFYDMPANLVANYFRNENLLISPNQYAQSLPEGAYRFGIEVVDANTNRPLSGVQYGTPVWLTVNEPPVWVIPTNNTLVTPLSPQSVNFQWAPRHKNVTDVEYEFSITEINSPNDYVGNYQNLFLSQPSIYSTRTRQTNLNYNYTLPPLTPGKIYAYRVRAIAKRGLEDIGIFRNNGFSEIQWFKYDQNLMPPFNETVERKGKFDFLVNWEGHGNEESFDLFYRKKGEEWTIKEISKASAERGINQFEDVIYLLPNGSYEFQLAAKGSQFYQTAKGPIFYYKDTLEAPFDLKPAWFDSTTAYLSWSGVKNHSNFKVLYAPNITNVWKEFSYKNGEDYAKTDSENSFAAYIPHVNWDSSYLFKVVAYDLDNDTRESPEAYLKFRDKEENPLKLEEKSISGTVYWSFLQNEVNLGSVSGTAQDKWIISKNLKSEPKLTFIHENKEVSNNRHPLTFAKIEVFADKNCNVLLKTIAASTYGNFSISFPAEALRGGLLPDKIYLRTSHEVFGSFIKEIDSKSFEDALDIGEWTIPATTFRFTSQLVGRGKEYSIPSEHTIKIYRRTSALEAAPYLKFENFGSVNAKTERINNEDYFQVAELKPGQIAAGMFYSASKFKQEYLLKIEGPVPYLEKLEFNSQAKQNGVFEYEIQLSQSKGKPYIYGDVTFENSDFNGESVELVLTSPSGINQSVYSGTEGNYRFELPISAVEKKETYTIEVYFKGNKVESATFQLDFEQMGTRKDFLIKPRPMVAVLALMVDESNKIMKRIPVNVNGGTYRTNGEGWLAFLAFENSTAVLKIDQTGYETKTINLPITSQSLIAERETVASIRKGIKEDLTNLKDGVKSNWPTHDLSNGTISNKSYELGYKFYQSAYEDAIYAGASTYKVLYDAKPLPFKVNFYVTDFNTGEPIPGVNITENKLDNIGETDSEGTLVFDSHIGRTTQVFQITPGLNSVDANGLKYAKDEVAYKFPSLSSTEESITINIKLYSGGIIRGKVYENGSTKILANATVKMEFLGIESEVKTNESGEYLFSFSATEEENFITLTAQKEEFYDRVVHMATSSSYGLSYTRDIYMKPGIKLEGVDKVESSFNFFDLYGFNISAITKLDMEDLMAQFTATFPSMKAQLPISGIISDKQGNAYNFEDLEVSVKVTGFTSIEIVPITEKVSLTLYSGELLYADKLPVSTSSLLNLSPISSNNKEQGIIHAQTFGLEASKLSEQISGIYSDADLTLFQESVLKSNKKNRGFRYNTNISGANFNKYLYPIAHSEGKIPVSELHLFAGLNTKSGPTITELANYYDANSSDKSKIRKAFGKANDEINAFVVNNIIFESLLATPKIMELNNLVVMPLLSIPNIHIDLLDIDKLRLANDEIDEILIDYSQSPRKLSMGDDIVQAQIEEVYVESDGVDIVYFTNNEGNKINANTASLAEIKYNANGIFYSDYKNQKQVVQTAAVLNEVPMFKIPKPAMGPGNRIKILASADGSPEKLGYLDQFFNDDSHFSSSGGLSYSPKIKMEAGAAEANLTLEGIASVTLDPHTFKLKWKYDNDKQTWETELESWEAYNKSFWGTWVLRPKKVMGLSSNTVLGDTESSDELLPPADINEGELKLQYGAAIPLMSSFDMEVEAKWDESLNGFRREMASGNASMRIPAIISLEAGAILLFDSTDKVGGLFLSVNGNLEIMEAEISGAGGYVNVNNDIIWGGNLGVGSGGGVGPPSFKMYSLKVGFLYDKANEASFIQLATSIGVGKESVIPSEVVQYTKDSTAAQRADKASTDYAIKTRWKRSSNALNPKYVAFDELFIASSGRSAFEPKDHDVSISDAEVTVAFSKKSGGWTLTGAAGISLKGQYLLDGAFLVSNDEYNNWRFFLGIPSFTRAKVGPFLDFTANFQIDFGNAGADANNVGKGNFFVMGAAEGDWPVHAIIYLKLSAKVAIGVNAQTDADALADATTAGGTTLSATASKIVQFMGSSFNDIAEESLQQRASFFDAIPDSFKDSEGLFSGIYFGIQASVLVGVNKDFENSLMAGSARAGIGLELQLGLLKTFNDGQFELRFSAAPVIDLGVKARSPVDMILFEYTKTFAKICGAGYTSDITKKDTWKWRFLFTLFSFDEVLGAGGKDSDCNSAGLLFVHPCLHFYFYTDPDNSEFKGGKWVLDTKMQNDFATKTCPIVW